MSDYEQHHYDKDLLRQAGIDIGSLEVSPGADLEQVRALINQMMEENPAIKLNSDWCFVDCKFPRLYQFSACQIISFQFIQLY